jgi:hypothetical protein
VVWCAVGASTVGAAVLVNSGEQLLLSTALAPRLFVRLYNSPIPVTWVSLLNEFPPAVSAGFGDIEVTGSWPPPQIDGTGQAYSQLPVLTWTRGAGGGPETIYGWVLYELPSPDSVLICGNLFTQPIPTNAPGQVVVLSLLAVLLRG